MQHTAIIVESNLINRRQLAEELRESGSAAVLEALSCEHGLQLLGAVRLVDTCLVGPRLRVPAATQFLRSGQKIVAGRSTPCSFFALVPEFSPIDHRKALRDAGATGILAGTVGDSRFQELVRRAVTREIVSFADDLGLTETVTRTISVDRLQDGPFIPENHHYTVASMHDVLLQLASRFETLAGHIDGGRFQVRKNGVPSLATADAIRVTLEAAFPLASDVRQIGSPGHHFIDAIVRWFEQRPHLGTNEANELLRRVLIERMPQ